MSRIETADSRPDPIATVFYSALFLLGAVVVSNGLLVALVG